MSPDRKLIERFRLKDPGGYFSLKAKVRILAPMVAFLLLACVFMDAYDFYQYQRFDNAQHLVGGLVMNVTAYAVIMLMVARFWFLLSVRNREF